MRLLLNICLTKIVILLGYFCSADASIPAAKESKQKNCSKDEDDKVSGLILSPGYPYEYPNNLNYTRIILTGNKTSVNFTILDLEAETNGENDCYDYLKIERLDVSPCCKTLFKGCRNHTDIIGTEGKEFRVSFISDNDKTRKGFKLYWTADDSIDRERIYYKEVLKSEKGEMTSPDYPCNYPNNVNFTWIIKPGKIKDIVNFTILDLQAETKNGRSCYDYLQITRFDPCCSTLIDGCTMGTYSIVLYGDHFQVSFISDYSVTKKGFMLLWQVQSPLKQTTVNSPSTPLFDASTRVNTTVSTTLSYQTDAQTCKGDGDIYSIYGILFLSMSGLSGMLVLVIVGIVSHYKKQNHRNHLQLMSGNTDYQTPEGRPDSTYAELHMVM